MEITQTNRAKYSLAEYVFADYRVKQRARWQIVKRLERESTENCEESEGVGGDGIERGTE